MAGKTVDELIVKIRADTKDLRKKLDKTNRQLKRTGETAKKSSKDMAGGFSKAKLALVALTAAVIKAVTYVARVGMEFEDLSLSLDKVFGGIEQGKVAMDRVLNFAQTTPFQVETVTKAFIALKSAGIEPNEKQLQTFADTASVATDSLGTFEALIRLVQRSASGGMGLEELNMISDRGIDVLSIFKEKLGLTKDDIAAFGKTAEGAALMVDALQLGLQEQFGDAMEDKMKALSTKTSNLTIAWKLLMNEIYKSGLADALKEKADSFALFLNKVSGWMKEYRETGGVNIYSVLNPDPFVPEEPEDDPDLGTKEEREKIRLRGQEIKLRAELLDLYEKSRDPLRDIKTLMEQGDEALKGYFDRLKAAGQIDEKLGFPEFREAINDMIDKAEEVETATGAIAEAVVSASHAFTTDFVNALLDAESALDAFKDFAKNIVSQIIAIFLQMAVVNKILNAVFGEGGAMEVEGWEKLPTTAGGGQAQRGQARLVGERGPEIFIPHSSGRVVNNADSSRFGGGQPIVVNQNISFATGVVPTVRAEVIKLMPQIANVTKASVFEAANRGGQFGKTLRGG